MASETKIMRNELQPFTSDGCSRFPNGIPYLNEKKWLKCCIRHDIAYWQGGTAEQRAQADEGLRQCVAQTGETVIANAMYLGVRVGGYTGLPTTWRWGYGWVINRGYRELSSEEQAQVQEKIVQIPEDLEQIPIQSPPIVPQRASLTGDYCYDAAIKQIQLTLGRGFEVLNKEETIKTRPEGWFETLTITTDGCEEPFQFTFLLLKPDACRSLANELAARLRIRLRSMVVPRACSR